MTVKYGTIEYFELLGLQAKLKLFVYNKFDLPSLDRLRNEIHNLVESAKEIEKYRRSQTNSNN